MSGDRECSIVWIWEQLQFQKIWEHLQLETVVSPLGKLFLRSDGCSFTQKGEMTQIKQYPINETSPFCDLHQNLILIHIHKDFSKSPGVTLFNSHQHQNPSFAIDYTLSSKVVYFVPSASLFQLNRGYDRRENLLFHDPASLVNRIRHASSTPCGDWFCPPPSNSGGGKYRN